jgi:hypothetical protein
MSWLRWAPLIAATLHIFEEFVWPGGFSEWYHRYQPSVALSFTPRFAVVINGILLLACLGAALQGPTPQGVALWLTVVAILLGNVGFHIMAVLRTGAYSPGVVTAVLLYLPLGIYGFRYFIHARLASTGTAAAALLVGFSYPIWSQWNHRRRSARARSA